jgi:glycolate oxidase FAD binding subunit
MATAPARRRIEAPGTPEQAADLMRTLGEEGRTVRPVGGRTKLGWGSPAPAADVELSTEKLTGIIEHNEGDYTVRVRAGTPARELQEALEPAGQMLALDAPLGPGKAATVGGMFSAADSGPRRHRYGGPRDLVLGCTAVLSDGTVASAGGRVIKNVAGYDLSKLYTGAFGTLGLLAEVAVRLHPIPERTATLVGESGDARALARAASHLAHSTLEMDCLDLRWQDGHGKVLARFGGAAAVEAARGARAVLAQAGLEGGALEEDDAELWEAQRDAQRSPDGVVVKVSAVQTRLGDVLEAAERASGSVVGRAAHGLCWVALSPQAPEKLVEAVEGLRLDLAPLPCVVQDAPDEVRAKVDVWSVSEGPALDLMRRLKPRFDPGGICNPGVYIGGI